jgi:DNA polymerase elongation subunit (family B)
MLWGPEFLPAIYTTAQIADALNREGFSPPKRRRGFFPDLVRQLMVRRSQTRSEAHTEKPGPHEWWLSRLAAAIGRRRSRGH